ncbi:NAD(P)H-dependent oxidoreductase [Buchananella felis]|uniref:NAD(P)H-dependent oxidoreductase n=1 Tax=Buchananella felis TaxID=3231492 RepID=UPI0035277237
MRTLVLLFHPDLAASKANARLAAAAQSVEGVTVRDIYALYPDGKFDVEAEQAELAQADRVVWQFPIHWYSAPGRFQEWLDTVFAFGWSHGPGGKALAGKELMVAVTTGMAARMYDPEGAAAYPITDLLRPFQATAIKVGMRYLAPFTVHGMAKGDDAALEAAAADYAAALTDAERPELDRVG